MKKIGLIGGMSWESTSLYYELINKKVKELKGGLHSADCVIESVDFSDIAVLQAKDDWDELNEIMIKRAMALNQAGAELLLICANTMHLCFEAIQHKLSIPVIHIARATAEVIKGKNLSRVALLGTKFTMEKDFFKRILTDEYGIEVLIPNQEQRDMIHEIIYSELVLGLILDSSRDKYLKVMNQLIQEGAQGIILGCTEIPLLISDDDLNVPLFNTTKIHAEKAVELALK